MAQQFRDSDISEKRKTVEPQSIDQELTAVEVINSLQNPLGARNKRWVTNDSVREGSSEHSMVRRGAECVLKGVTARQLVLDVLPRG